MCAVARTSEPTHTEQPHHHTTAQTDSCGGERAIASRDSTIQCTRAWWVILIQRGWGWNDHAGERVEMGPSPGVLTGDEVAGLVGPRLAVVRRLPDHGAVRPAGDGAAVGAVQHQGLAGPREAAGEGGAVVEERPVADASITSIASIAPVITCAMVFQFYHRVCSDERPQCRDTTIVISHDSRRVTDSIRRRADSLTGTRPARSRSCHRPWCGAERRPPGA